MKTNSFFLTTMVLTAGLLAGCATPEARIQRNQAAFARLAPAQQELIKQGNIALGFDQEMVRLALGNPDRILMRTDAQGTSEMWSYATWDPNADNYPIFSPGWHHRRAAFRDPFYPYYFYNPATTLYERLRVTFQEGKVVTIDKDNR